MSTHTQRRTALHHALACLVILALAASLQAQSAIGLNEQGADEGTPPDTQGAVSPTHIFHVTNGEVQVYDRAGRRLSSENPAAFWESIGLERPDDPFDPRIAYDTDIDKFYFTMLDEGHTDNHLYFAVSHTSDPTGDWSGLRIATDSDSGERWMDFPMLGYNDEVVTISGDMQPRSGFGKGGEFSIAVLPKSDLSGNTPQPTYTLLEDQLSGTKAFRALPVRDLDFASLPHYLLSSQNLSLSRITGSASNPQVEHVTNLATQINRPAAPGPILQPSAGEDSQPPELELNRRMSSSPVVRNGTLWAVEPRKGALDRSEIALHKVDLDQADVTQFTTFAQQDMDLLDPSIAVNSEDTFVIGFSAVGEKGFYPSAWYVVGRALPSGLVEFETPTLIREGFSIYRGLGGVGVGGQAAWGDFSDTGVDPTDDDAFWTFQQLAAGAGYDTTLTEILLPNVTAEWRSDTTDSFFEADMWSTPFVPDNGAGGNERVAAVLPLRGAPYTVTLHESKTLNSIGIEGGATLQQVGGTLDVGIAKQNEGDFRMLGGTVRADRWVVEEGSITIRDDSTFRVAGDERLILGRFGQARATIDRGATVSTGWLYLAERPGIEATLDITGPETSMEFDDTAFIAMRGTGTATVSGGARVTGVTTDPDTDEPGAETVIGFYGGHGTLRVTGTAPEIDGQPSSWTTGRLVAGRQGQAVLEVLQGARVQAQILTVAEGVQAENSSATVDGAGSIIDADEVRIAEQKRTAGRLTVQNDGRLQAGEIFAGLQAGAIGSLEVNNARAEAAGLTLGRQEGLGQAIAKTSGRLEIGRGIILGDEADSIGLLTVETGAYARTATLTVGQDGSGRAEFDGGATADVDELIVGQDQGASGILTLRGAASRVNVLEQAVIGAAATSELTVDDGAFLDVNKQLVLGREQTGRATALVTGFSEVEFFQPSLVEVDRSAGGDAVFVGVTGSGELNIRNGATVRVPNGNMGIGWDSGGSGVVSVQGAAGSGEQSVPALLEVDDHLRIGRQGQAELNIGPGGQVLVGGVTYLGHNPQGQGARLIVTGGTLTTRSLEVAPAAAGDFDDNFRDGTILVEAGRFVLPDHPLIIDGQSAGDEPTFRLADSASANLTIDSITVAARHAGRLELSGGSSLDSQNATVGAQGDASGAARINDAAWTQDGDLTIGRAGAGEVEVLAGGRIAVDNQAVLGEETSGQGQLALRSRGSAPGPVPQASRIEVGEAMIVAEAGTADLELTGGGKATIDHDLHIARQAGSRGAVSVTGTFGNVPVGTNELDSRIEVGRDLHISAEVTDGPVVTGVGVIPTPSGAGEMTIADSASVLVEHTTYVGTPLSDSAKLTLTNRGELVTGSLEVSDADNLQYDSGKLTIDGGKMTGFRGRSFVLGRKAGSKTNLMTLRSGGRLLLGPDGGQGESLTVGFGSTATLRVESGSRLTSGPGVVGGSQILLTGLVPSPDRTEAENSRFRGVAHVTGQGSTWDVTGPLSLGRPRGLDYLAEPIGLLTVSDGAAVAATDQLTIYPDSELRLHDGTVNADVVSRRNTALSGTGSLGGDLQTAGLLMPGNDTGLLSIAGDLELSETSELLIRITEQSAPAFGELQVDGTATLAGTVTFDLEPGTSLGRGEVLAEIPFVTADAIQGRFDRVNVNNILAEASYKLTIDQQQASLTLVPEPAACVLLALGSLALVRKRRRRPTA